MIRVLIVEDEAPARAKLRSFLSQEDDIEIVGEAADGPTARDALARLAPDVVFLDIQIPQGGGLDLLDSIGPPPHVVFVTAHDEYAVPAFDADATDYLLKPYDRERLTRSVARVRQRLLQKALLQKTKSADRIAIPAGNQLRFLAAADILWIEADNNYVRIHTSRTDYFLRRSMTDILGELGEERFARIHKSRAVKISEIEAMRSLASGDVEIRLRGGTTLRMSRRYRRNLLPSAR